VRLAERKAAAVPAGPDETVLGADTTVVIDGEMLGKPADAADARRMLERLSGRQHEVITGICLKRGLEVVRDFAATKVWFALMSAREIEEYAASGEPMDKAAPTPFRAWRRSSSKESTAATSTWWVCPSPSSANPCGFSRHQGLIIGFKEVNPNL